MLNFIFPDRRHIVWLHSAQSRCFNAQSVGDMQQIGIRSDKISQAQFREPYRSPKMRNSLSASPEISISKACGIVPAENREPGIGHRIENRHELTSFPRPGVRASPAIDRHFNNASLSRRIRL
ncbi:MAG: hypothetical protein ACLUKN_04120 [Bacilli bacterium]